MRTRIFSTLAVGVLLLALSAFAQMQSRGGRFWQQQGANAGSPTNQTPPSPEQMAQNRVNRLANLLNLTDDQKAKATTIFTSAMTSEQALRQQFQAAEQALRDAVKANNTAGINQAANTIGGLTAQRTAIQANGEAQLYALLTPDQQAKMPNGPMFFGGPRGGPGGPGMGMGRMRQPGTGR